MPPVRKTSGDARSARTQLKTADQSARVAKESRARDDKDALLVPLRDKEWLIGHAPSLMTFMEWTAATGGENLVATYHVLEELVHEEDWTEFKKFCRKEDIDPEEFGVFINAGLEALAGRPTGESAGS